MKKRIIGVIFVSIFLLILFSISIAALHPNIENQKEDILKWNNDLIKYSRGDSSLSLEEILKKSEQRKGEMLDLMKRDVSSFLQHILTREIRDKLPAEVQNNIEKDFIEAGRLALIIVDKEDGEEYIYQLAREDVIYDLFIVNTESLSPNNYYRVSGFILDNKVAVENINPLLGIKKEEPPVNPDANGVQKIAIVLIGFKDKPFSYEEGGMTKEDVDWAIKEFANFYYRESYNRMPILYRVFEYTSDKATTDYPCVEVESLLSDLKQLRKMGKLDFIPEEYNTVFGLISEDFCGSIAGVAYMGNYNGMFGIAQLIGSELDIDSLIDSKGLEASLIGHEIGHTRGLGHVSEISNCWECLMWFRLGSSNTIDKAIFLQSEKDQLGWDPNNPILIPSVISDARVFPASVFTSRNNAKGARISFRIAAGTSEVFFGKDKNKLIWEGQRANPRTIGGYKIFDLFASASDDTGKLKSLEPNTLYYYNIVSTLAGAPEKYNDNYKGAFIFEPLSEQQNEQLAQQNVLEQQNEQRQVIATYPFLRGDSNEDGYVDLSDAVYTLGVLFGGKPMPVCPDAADTNDDGKVDLSDAVYLLSYLFKGGIAIPEPSEDYGFDPTVDEFECNF